jgi:hypothetical protein
LNTPQTSLLGLPKPFTSMSTTCGTAMQSWAVAVGAGKLPVNLLAADRRTDVRRRRALRAESDVEQVAARVVIVDVIATTIDENGVIVDVDVVAAVAVDVETRPGLHVLERGRFGPDDACGCIHHRPGAVHAPRLRGDSGARQHRLHQQRHAAGVLVRHPGGQDGRTMIDRESQARRMRVHGRDQGLEWIGGGGGSGTSSRGRVSRSTAAATSVDSAAFTVGSSEVPLTTAGIRNVTRVSAINPP